MWLLNTTGAGAGMAGNRVDADTTTVTAEAALQHAFDAFQQGADLFEAASKTIKDHGALAAVNLLIIQNRKQMKDITRRLNTLKIQERLRQMNLEKAEALKQQQQQPQQHSRALGLNKRTTTTGLRARSADTPKQTAAAAATASDTRTERTATSKTNDEPGTTTTTTTSSPSTATALNDPDKRPRRRRLNPAASILGSSSMYDHPSPISQRDTTTTRALCRSPENRYPSASSAGGGGGGQRLATTTAPSTCASSVYEPGGGGSVYTPGYGGGGGGGGGASGRSSSLGSSSAALGAAVDLEDGMVYVAHPLGSSDPFARFWNMLETALDQMSNPVAFASMPTDLPQVIDPIHETMGKKHHHRRRKRHSKEEERDGVDSGGRDGRHAACEAMGRRKSRDCERGKEDVTLGKGKRADPLSDSSSGDSFCVISKESLRDDSSVHSGKSSLATTSRTQSVSTLHASAHSILASRTTIINGKTPEELALENTNLRSSLDTLSQRFQVLERELQTYKRNSEHRQEMMKSVVLGVRREAQKAIYQSQIIGGSVCLDGKSEKEYGDRSGASSARLGSPLRHTVGLSEVEKSSSPRQRIRTPLTYEYADEDPFAMDNDPEEDEPVETTPHLPVMATNHPADPTDDIDDVDVLRRRLQEVETENQGLKVENQRSRSHLQKYRDRFERMKVSSRAKKEAKLSTGGMQRASELPTLGEEGE
ncbi:hypothetical protein QFC21_000544 [Naganishia friedmannii]|uniref:Uncharacterized protein n=1 Tax=Naganishia friedmannii TaxID=89922 RepID=A0ACC2WDL1_9TREE|nr:hypothetical protein QFC21_000544 [Naganishia friedmannii]